MALSKLLTLSNSSKPLVCLEVNPPKGTDLSAVFERLQDAGQPDLFNVTDCALAKVRLSCFAFAHLLKTRFGVEPLVNYACRDRNIIGMQSDLLGAWALGIRSIVALTGDAVTVGDLPDAKGVFEVNSVGLLNMIRTLGTGMDLAGKELKGRPDFIPGVVVNPNVKNPDAEIRRLVRKREAGATYALSQPVFDPELGMRFCQKAADSGVEIMLGVMPVRSEAAAIVISRVPGIRIPEEFIELVRGKDEEEVAEISIRRALEVAALAKPYVRGFHVISGGAERRALHLTKRLRQFVDQV